MLSLLGLAALLAALSQIGVLFLGAGLAKLTAQDLFRRELKSERLLPPVICYWVSRVLPPSELLLGIWLLSGIQPRLASFMAVVFLACFIAYRVVLLVVRGRRGGCGCMGKGLEFAGAGDRLGDIFGVAVNLSIAIVVASVVGGTAYAYSQVYSLVVGMSVILAIAFILLRVRPKKQRRVPSAREEAIARAVRISNST